MKYYVLLPFIMLALINPIAIAQNENKMDNKNNITTKSVPNNELRANMRKLWEDHITYTRNFIISALADLGDKDAVTKRLLKNQDDIGNAIKPYYGEEAGNKLTQLLRDHILIAAEVVDAAKKDQKKELQDAQSKWSANGKDIAKFLSNANTNWSKADLEKSLQKHLDLTTGEVVNRLKQNWNGDIKSYDEGHEHILKLSDTLSEGIEKQFPDKMKSSNI